MAGADRFLVLIYFIVIFSDVRGELTNNIDEDVLTTQAFVYWPNGTVPFYINRNHFDAEQITSLMSALSLVTFKTCVKFAPVLAQPQHNEHVLTFENPTGLRKCELNTEPHNLNDQQIVVLGYDCLRSPEIYMVIMKELGFPFEHNRAVRDLYIEVQMENIEPGYLDLYVKDLRHPVELRSIPYDRNSVMHFGEREYSKNGHKTIIFKDRNFRQERFGLSPIDLRKIEIVYGPECKKRDRQEKVDLCQNYPGVARRKREAPSKSLRVNPDITPPPDVDEKDKDHKPNEQGYIDEVIQELGIGKEVEDLIYEIHKTASAALVNARERLCNGTNPILRTGPLKMEMPKDHNVLAIIGELASYTKNLVETATQNLTEFCAPSQSVLLRASCPFYNTNMCKPLYKSTKSGAVMYSTQHRPIMKFSTKHYGKEPKHVKENLYANLHIRSGAENETAPAENVESNATQVTKQDLQSHTRKTNAGRDVLGPRFTSEKNNVTEEGKIRKKREVSEKTVSDRTSTTKFAAKPTFSKSSNGSKVLKRRFQGKTFRARKTLGGEEDKDEVDWDESAVSMDHEKGDATTATRPRKRKASSKPDAFYHIPQSGDVSGTTDTSTETGEHNQETKPKESVHGPFGIFQEEADNSDSVQIDFKSHKSAKSSAKNNKKEKQHQNRATLTVPSKHKKKSNQHRLQSTHKLRQPVPSAVTNRQEDNERDDEMSSGHYKSAPKQHKVKKTAAQLALTKRPASSSSSSRGLPDTVELTQKNKEFYNERKWPDNTVRYLIHDSGDFDLEDCRARLAEVRAILRKATCVSIEEITEAQTDLFEDYLVLDNSPDFVTGRVGGKQIFGAVELLQGGQHRQHAAMVVMAMLGFYFEVSRHDRDQFIRVHVRHIRPDKLHHFEKIREDATFMLPYDYKSATHPAWQFWRHLGKSGISTVATFKEQDPDGLVMKSLGQNEQLLSDLDIIKINSIYGIECFKPKDARADHGKDNEDPGMGESNEPPDEDPAPKQKEVEEVSVKEEKEAEGDPIDEENEQAEGEDEAGSK